jgi:hypothetical protein
MTANEFLRSKGYNGKAVTQSRLILEKLMEQYAALSEDSTIEKVKELREKYEAKRKHIDSFGIVNAVLLGRYEAYGLFIDEINAIIEAK